MNKDELLCTHWYQAWQRHIQSAYRNPEARSAYCRAALIAQMEYVTYHALEAAQ